MATHETPQGHGDLAREIRGLVDRARAEKKSTVILQGPQELQGLVRTDQPSVSLATLVVPDALGGGEQESGACEWRLIAANPSTRITGMLPAAANNTDIAGNPFVIKSSVGVPYPVRKNTTGNFKAPQSADELETSPRAMLC